jgi:hypothetical protein
MAAGTRTPVRRGAGGGGGGRRGGGGGGSGAGSPEHRSGGSVRTALISGNTFRAKAVQYSEIDGYAIFEGDIVLGTVAEVEAASEALRRELSGQDPASVVITGNQFRWPGCTVPFTIESTMPNQARVTQAIAHWEANTGFRFVARTTEADFVTFRNGTGCSSPVGRRGGQQFVTIENPGCDMGRVVHEIGHAIGFWHEQSREDRDTFVVIHWDKIQAGREHNFNQHITDGDDVGAYDYGSIMHYERDAFSIDGSDTITPINPATAAIGQRVGLSAGDIASANIFCPRPKRIFDDLTVKEIRKEIRLDTRKELISDTRKELIADTRKELILDTAKEVINDTIKEGAFDPGNTFVETIDPFGGGGVILPGLGGARGPGAAPGGQQGGGLPFAMRAAHQAPGATDPASLEPTVATLDAQLAALAEHIAQLEAARQQAQAQYDETAALLASTMDAHDAASGG